jgi:hypothetical protein
MAATATAPARKAAAPARKAAPPRKPRPARRAAPRRAPVRGSRRIANLPTPPGGHLSPLAVGRTAVAVRHIPDTGAIRGLTRGRAWIPFLGLLLAGLVALNVLTLSLTTSAGKIDQQIQTLGQENSVLRTREAKRLSNGRVASAAATIGLLQPGPQDITYVDGGRDAVATAARRLAQISG